MSMLQKIAFFDFDGTITKADSMLELIKFHFGKKKYFLGLVIAGFYLLGLKMGFLTRQRAKERFLTHFWGGMDANQFEEICKTFSVGKLPSLIRREAVDKINEFKNENVEVVVVTASASDWVKYWCESQNLAFISSEMDVQSGKITGKLKGLNCNGPEKASRIKRDYDLSQYGEIYCFGDSSGDKEMFSLATKSYYQKFN